MHLNALRLQNFRNIEWAELHFDGRQQFFLGINGQGKTNLLEAVGYASSLRSFRTHDTRDLIRHGSDHAALAWDWALAEGAAAKVVAELRPKAKRLSVDDQPVYRLQDYIGRFPSVVFSSQDQQLVRGGPSLRRRWLDIVLSSTSPTYLHALSRYLKALDERNRLLKRGASDAEVDAFTQPLADAAVAVVSGRLEAMPALAAEVATAYARIAPVDDPASLALARSGEPTVAPEWIDLWRQNLVRDRAIGSTQTGPHRDDLVFKVQGRPAQDFGSEGQQRTFALALRLAEWNWLKVRRGVDPLVLADDVLSELDDYRRTRFWAAVSGSPQVIATGTRLPEADLGHWSVWRVEGGRFIQGGQS